VLISDKGVPVQIHHSLVTKAGVGLQMRAEGTKGTLEFEELYRGKAGQSSRLTLRSGREDRKIIMGEHGVALLPACLFRKSQKRFINEINSIKGEAQQDKKQVVNVATIIERNPNMAVYA
jgi:hypothetical protein